jgi:hypothetical protein
MVASFAGLAKDGVDRYDGRKILPDEGLTVVEDKTVAAGSVVRLGASVPCSPHRGAICVPAHLSRRDRLRDSTSAVRMSPRLPVIRTPVHLGSRAR